MEVQNLNRNNAKENDRGYLGEGGGWSNMKDKEVEEREAAWRRWRKKDG